MDLKYQLDRGKAYGGDARKAINQHRANHEKKRPKILNKRRVVSHETVDQLLTMHEHESRVFVLERRQVMEFEHSDWKDFNPNYCWPPYETFTFRPASPINIDYGDLEPSAYDVKLIETTVYTGDHDMWYIMETMEFESDIYGKQFSVTGVWLNIQTAQCGVLKYEDQWLGGATQFSVRKMHLEPKYGLMYTECQVTARNVINFLHLINNRKTEVKSMEDPGRPVNRQQRKAAEYVDRDHYKVTIPKRRTVSDLIAQAVEGHNLRYRRPHDVRGHLRHLKHRDEPVKVRKHRRGEGEIKYIPDYDCGLIRKTDLEPIEFT